MLHVRDARSPARGNPGDGVIHGTGRATTSPTWNDEPPLDTRHRSRTRPRRRGHPQQSTARSRSPATSAGLRLRTPGRAQPRRRRSADQRAPPHRVRRAVHLQHPALGRQHDGPGGTTRSGRARPRDDEPARPLQRLRRGPRRRRAPARQRQNMITCATDCVGMYDDNVFPIAIPALQDLSNCAAADRLHQDLLDFVYLGRARHPTGCRRDLPCLKSTSARRSPPTRPLLSRAGRAGSPAAPGAR